MSELDELANKEITDDSRQTGVSKLKEATQSYDEPRWQGRKDLERFEKNGTIMPNEKKLLDAFRKIDQDYQLHPEDYASQSKETVIRVEQGSLDDPLADDISKSNKTSKRMVKRTVLESDEDCLVFDENGHCPYE